MIITHNNKLFIFREDIPATIDYVLKCTSADSLHYISHSMGATVFFVGMSEKPEYCDKITSMVALAPAVFGNSVNNKWLTWFVVPLTGVLV
jgi:pimeloyl-ACP methyl ester carboxylesterase